MLGLHFKTSPCWADRVLEQPAELLLDHYFSELKAAAMAQRTLRIHGGKHPRLKSLMLDLAAEEMGHARTVEGMLRRDFHWPQAARGGNPYVQALRRMADLSGHGTFLDMLLVCSLVEARSAERFKLLADATRGTPFGGFYEDFYASEVNHYILFVKLGCECCGVEETLRRLEEFRAAEAEIIRAMPAGPRVHSRCLGAEGRGPGGTPGRE